MTPASGQRALQQLIQLLLRLMLLHRRRLLQPRDVSPAETCWTKEGAEPSCHVARWQPVSHMQEDCARGGVKTATFLPLPSK